MIESFLEYTEGISSPYIFRLWSAIGLIAGVLERKVYLESAGERLFPNLFILLVSPPGVGKTQAIKNTAALWKKVPNLFVSPDNLTKSALIDNLLKASRKIVKSPIELIEFNSMQIAADELGVFMSQHDLDFLSVLNKIYDNPADYVEDRRMFKGVPIYIPEPQMTLLAGTQPGFMASIFPEEAWSMGFTSRLIMVFSATKTTVSLFDSKTKNTGLFKGIVEDLGSLSKVLGQFKLTKEVKEALEWWNSHGQQETAPVHSKLEHYTQRRILHLLKLCMISSASRSNDLLIAKEDYDRALTWLLMAEKTMPDIFRTMSQKSDASVIQDLHFHMWQKYSKEKKPMHESYLVHFLQTKVPSERVMKIIEIAERAGIIIRMASTDTYRPATKGAEGVE